MDRIEQKICQIIEERAEEIIAFGTDIWNHAELGYREFRTAGKFVEGLRALGLDAIDEGVVITGVKAYLKGKQADGPTLCLMGELDALPISNHPNANPETGASHCCGHNAQLTGVLGAAMALTDPEVLAALGGNVVFCAVPSEEFVEIELKNDMRKEGKIRYGGGKCEFIRVGAMDDIDLVIGHHSTNNGRVSVSNGTGNGFVNKLITYHGKSSHAAGSPHKGVDALAAAALAMHCIDVQRETFRDQDTVRVHGFISRGGEAMNVIADHVTMEYSVRAKNIEANIDAHKKVDRALRAAAMATGAGLTIETIPGYLCTIPADDPSAVVEAARDAAGDRYEVYTPEVKPHGTGSTDYGDISAVMPLIQFGTGGFSGIMHNPNVMVDDPYLAYVVTAKVFALSAYKMLKEGGARAKAIADGFVPLLTKEKYLEYMESMLSEEHIPMTALPILEDS